MRPAGCDEHKQPQDHEHVRQFGGTATQETRTLHHAAHSFTCSTTTTINTTTTSTRTSTTSSTSSTSSSLVDQLTGILALKSSSLLGSLKQHYTSFTSTQTPTPHMSTSQLTSGLGTNKSTGSDGSNTNQQVQQQRSAPASARTSQDDHRADNQEAPATPRRPPLPRPPPRELVQACQSASDRLSGDGGEDINTKEQPAATPTPTHRRHALQEHSLERDAALSLKSNTKELLKHKRTSSIRSALRHAHLPGALRSSASTSKRAAEKAATAAVLMAQQATGSCESTIGPSGKSAPIKSKPYELFEPQVTQRTFERSKRRRDAMLADPRRQMSADTMIGLRQLTDEYLQNAGVQPIYGSQAAGNSGTTTSGSLVALSGPLTGRKMGATKAGTIAVPGSSSTMAAIALGGSGSGSGVGVGTSGQVGGGQSAASSQAQCALEAHLYQATRQANLARESTMPSEFHYYQRPPGSTQGEASTCDTGADHHMATTTADDDEQDNDQTSQVTMLPGDLPWQCDVAIQCELLQAPSAIEPYETTGDILNTIARPFRAPPLNSHSTASFESHTSGHHHNNNHHHHHHLSATLKRGLSAIGGQAHHHLSPVRVTSGRPTSMALNVVGNLKKSLSNTMFDVKTSAASSSSSAGHAHSGQLGGGGGGGGGTSNPFLRSQDSLPAYSSLQNEADDDHEHTGPCVGGEGQDSGLGRNNEGDDDQNQDKDNTQQRRRAAAANSSSVSLHAEQQPTSCGSSNQLGTGSEQSGGGGGGLIGQLASKLTRQSSKKFAVSKKGLQRALSFDYRGYKRLDGAATSGQSKVVVHQNTTATTTLANSSAMQSSADSTGSSTSTNSNFLVTSRTKQHNKSTLALQSPRPYLPQSASQVDFQVPLLPYERMQEAIVSQRLLDGHQQVIDTPPSATKQMGVAPDVDQMICAPPPPSEDLNKGLDESGGDSEREETQAQTAAGQRQQRQAHRRRAEPPPRLVLNIPPGSQGDHDDDEDDDDDNNNQQLNELQPDDSVIISGTTSGLLLTGSGQMSQSPSFCIDPDGRSASLKHRGDGGGGGLGGSTSGSPGQPPLTPTIVTAGDSLDNRTGTGSGYLLTASDVFNKSKSFIKRPSTMMAGDDGEDALNQVVQALESKAAQQRAQLSSSPSVRARNRRQAIVPPKMATDVCTNSSESDVPCTGTLVNLEDDDDEGGGDQGDQDDQEEQNERNVQRRRRRQSARSRRTRTSGAQAADEFAADEEEALSTIRRKRSGGGIEKAPPSTLPTFHIESETAFGASGKPAGAVQAQEQRPDSQATNADSIVSSGSSTTRSALASGRMSAGGGVPLSPLGSGGGGLSVPFASGSSGSRRRSSIAVIPQMQICPGDLLVYSKQLIERMNQSDEHEPPPQFLTIDDKKAKNNIWASFKLCAQFDNRTLRARNELLCSLEDVLASLQPSTFVDEQLSHYKGMLWNEFLYETESRRSASSDGLNTPDGTDEFDDQVTVKKSYGDDLVDVQISVEQNTPPPPALAPKTMAINEENQEVQCSTSAARRSASVRGDEALGQGSATTRESIKLTMSGGGSGHASPARTGASVGQQPGRTLSSRFREKPKLKRGQTVDSVFRIPLIPSSPLKHAQQHQQTPTAHLEHELNIIEDDERSSLGSGGGANSTSGTQNKSKRSRSGSRLNELATSITSNGKHDERSQESSFDADDTQDLVSGGGVGGKAKERHLNQIGRQASLSTLSSTITRTEQKRQRALWDLFQSECTFFFDHLMTLKNVYMEPLKKIQVEGFAMFADPDVLFGNLDELCCGVYDFCKEFLFIIMRTLKTRPEELNATDVLIKLYKKNPKIDHLRAVYHRYTLNYINALTYLESLRRQVEFVEFEKWSSRDVRCKKLQLTDLLVAPVQHIMRVPIILKDIETHTERVKDKDEIRAILSVEEASLRELDDKMRWLKNFERLLEIQKNINWPSVFEMEAKLYVPEFLREVLSKQPCEKLIVSPRRQIVHEGTLCNLDAGGKQSDMHVILFDDMLLMTRRKKCLTKKASTIVCKTNSAGDQSGGGSGGGSGPGGGCGSSSTSGSSLRDDGSFKYVVYKQPLSLDRFYVHDVQQMDTQSVTLKQHLFLLIVMNRFQQIISIHSFSAPNDDIKQTWLFKIKKTVERWKRNYSSSTATTTSEQSKQQQQQQQISTSKSMPMDSTGGSKRSSGPRAPPTTPQRRGAAAAEPTTTHAGQNTRTPDPSATVQYQSRQQYNTNDTNEQRQVLAQNNAKQTRQTQPIELVITSASESPDGQQKCRL